MEKTVEELRSLLAKATERPWIVDADMTPAKERVYFVKKERAKAVVAFVGNERYPFSEPDAQLIAAAVNALPALLASVEAALEWVTTPPSSNGWYWAFEPGTTDPVVVEVIEDLPGTYCVWDHDCAVHLSAFSHWAGPLTPMKSPMLRAKAAAGAGDSGAGVVE